MASPASSSATKTREAPGRPSLWRSVQTGKSLGWRRIIAGKFSFVEEKRRQVPSRPGGGDIPALLVGISATLNSFSPADEFIRAPVRAVHTKNLRSKQVLPRARRHHEPMAAPPGLLPMSWFTREWSEGALF